MTRTNEFARDQAAGALGERPAAGTTFDGSAQAVDTILTYTEPPVKGSISLVEQALAYLDRGWSVIPLRPRDKTPLITWREYQERLPTRDEVQSWWACWPNANVGVVTGGVSGIVVLDLDGEEGEEEVRRRGVPRTPTVMTGKGWHLYFAHPGFEVRNFARKAPGLDLRGDGGYVVAPPSVHPSGAVYRWEANPHEVPLAPLPDWLLKLVRRPGAMPAREGGGGERDGRFWLERALARAEPGTRNDTGLWLALQLRDDGLTAAEAEPIMREYARRAPNGDHPYTEREALATLEQVYRRPPREPARAVGGTTGGNGARCPANGAGARKAEAGEGERKRRPSQATLLVQLATGRVQELWHTPDGRAFATIQVGDTGGVDHLPLRLKAFRSWLARLAMQEWGEAGGVPHASAIEDAITTLEGIAVHDGPEYALQVRVGGDLEAVYLDLCDANRRVVEITADGWRVVTAPPVRFWRPSGMLPLPVPERGGSLQDLGRFLNVEPDDLPLVMGFLIGCLHPCAPYPVLALYGEQGSAKSTASRVLKALLDPAKAPLRKRIKEERDLAIAATNGWLIAFDNLSSLPQWLSDALCGLATGLGFGTRRLFTDDEEALFEARRPIILNGIDELAVRGDLRDRMIALTLPPIPDDRRRTEADFWREFERERPRLLGALLDAVVTAIRNWPETRLDRLPRMADFALWVHAAEPALGLPHGTFLKRYAGNRASAHLIILEADPVGRALLAWLNEQPAGFEWDGTATELLDVLNSRVPEEERPRRGWPQDATRMGGKMRRLAPALRGVGFQVVDWTHPKERTRHWIITKSWTNNSS